VPATPAQRREADEIAELDRHLEPLVRATTPKLVAQLGIGVQSVAQLLVTAGDNHAR
jgi:transposase